MRHSKTDAGSRYVDLLPVLRDELSAHKAASANAAPSAYVFPSAAGTRQDGGRVRGRVLAKAVKRANAQLAAEGQTPLPEGLTLHALRRTCASVLVALGKDPRYVMAQLGHTGPYGHTRNLCAGDELQRRRPRASAAACRRKRSQRAQQPNGRPFRRHVNLLRREAQGETGRLW